MLFDDEPLASFLALAPSRESGSVRLASERDGLLTVREVFDLDLRASLVTLSACSTGLGLVNGDGVLGLSRAFLAAGTPSVLVSLWRVADSVARFQMERFYRALIETGDKARAIRRAELETIQELRLSRLLAPSGRALPRSRCSGRRSFWWAKRADSIAPVIAGRATSEGTQRFAARSGSAPGHFREAMGVRLSSLGLGTYLGEEDAATDAGYEACVAAGLASGINVFDTAINYRGQKSERAIGRALARAFAQGSAARDEVFVSTKGGYLPHDAEDSRPPRLYVQESFLASGLAPAAEIAQGSHCMAPGYLRDQIARSRENLGLETIDLYYLHNIETQLSAVDRDAFRGRLARAIETVEEACAKGEIAAWGLATWDGLRVPPEHPEHLSMADVRALAGEVAGDRHHFRRRAAAGQSRDGARRRVPVPAGRGRPPPRPGGRAVSGSGRVRVGLAPSGPALGRPGRGDRGVFSDPRNVRPEEPCSFPGPRRE